MKRRVTAFLVGFLAGSAVVAIVCAQVAPQRIWAPMLVFGLAGFGLMIVEQL